jgi:signal transduction histidine kinase
MAGGKPSSKAESAGRKSAAAPKAPPKSHAVGKKRRGKTAAPAHLRSARKALNRNIAGRKRAESDLRQSGQELAVRNRISQIFLTVADDEMYAEVLDVVLDVLESEYGVFGYIDEDGALVVPSMRRHVWDQCQVAGKGLVFPRKTWRDSTWVRAIREKRTIHSNEPSTSVPTGHVPIRRHIAMPIIHLGEVIGIFEVANKESDYGEEDLRLLGIIAGHVAPILAARLQRDRQEMWRAQAEERVKAYQQRLRSLGAKLAVAEEQERRRIAAGLHDNVVQALALAKMKLEGLARRKPAARLAPGLREARNLVAQSIHDTRRIKQRSPGIQVLALSAHADRRFVAGILAAGAAGYSSRILRSRSCAGPSIL